MWCMDPYQHFLNLFLYHSSTTLTRCRLIADQREAHVAVLWHCGTFVGGQLDQIRLDTDAIHLIRSLA